MRGEEGQRGRSTHPEGLTEVVRTTEGSLRNKNRKEPLKMESFCACVRVCVRACVRVRTPPEGLLPPPQQSEAAHFILIQMSLQHRFLFYTFHLKPNSSHLHFLLPEVKTECIFFPWSSEWVGSVA